MSTRWPISSPGATTAIRREGFADYLALQVHPGAGVGPNARGYEWSTPIPSYVTEYLGTTRPPPDWLVSDMPRRRAYYFASSRFVKYLIDAKGMQVFLELYDSATPETDIARLYGERREELIRRAGM